MTVRLPLDQDVQMPLVRILVMPQGHWTDATQPWEVLPIPARMDRLGKRYYGRRHGYELDSVERACLPEIGAAEFHFDYGSINGLEYDIDDGTSLTTARDLMDYDVRIQLAAAPSTSTPLGTAISPTWKTVFLGTVIAQEERPWADDQITETLAGGGRRVYKCADLLWRTQRWHMNRHTVVTEDAAAIDREYVHCYGHPGYNWQIQGYYRRLLGNRWAGTWPLSGDTPDPFGDEPTVSGSATGNLANYIPHTWTGAASAIAQPWTDRQAVDHAFASSRAKGEPCFALKPGDPNLEALAVLNSSQFPWQVDEQDTCWDFINRVLDRRRARGLSCLWWTSNSNGSSLGTEADASGNLYPFVAVFPQFLDDITYTPPGLSAVTYYGATTCGTATAVDIAGDHRVPAESIRLAQNATATVDYLESFGEPIEIAVTLSPGDDTLTKRWTSGDETDFAAIPADKFWQKTADRWKYVWQRWTLPAAWAFQVKDGNGGTEHTINWYCDDDAALQSFDFSDDIDTTYRGNPSPLTCKILGDMPLYEGYNYASDAHTRYDGSSDTLSPPRLPPLILANYGDDTYLDVTTEGAGMSVDDFGVIVTTGNDIQNGTRAFSDPDNAQALGNVYGYTALVLTVGLQLPHRIRCASAADRPGGGTYGPTDACRRLSLYYPGVFLWLADYKAIWSINPLTATNPYMPAQRGAAGGDSSTPGIIRDDRAALLGLHHLAWAWYSLSHRTAQWQLRDCGLLPSFTQNDSGGSATTTAYPTLGQFVTDLTASQTYTLNTPITRIIYAGGVTTFITDWQDLDLSR